MWHPSYRTCQSWNVTTAARPIERHGVHVEQERRKKRRSSTMRRMRRGRGPRRTRTQRRPGGETCWRTTSGAMKKGVPFMDIWWPSPLICDRFFEAPKSATCCVCVSVMHTFCARAHVHAGRALVHTTHARTPVYAWTWQLVEV